MPGPTTDTIENGTTPLAAIELRYELAKRRISDVAVPARTAGPVHDTVTVDVRLTQALIPLPTTPAAEAPRPGRRFWRSLRRGWLTGRSLPAA